jgi:hypothetical protein
VRSGELAQRVTGAHRFGRPLAARPAGSHGGMGLERVERPIDLDRYLDWKIH